MFVLIFPIFEKHGTAHRASLRVDQAPQDDETVSFSLRSRDHHGVFTEEPAEAESIRVLVADDHGIVRAGLRTLLGASRDMHVVGESSSTTTLMAEVERTNADVVVLDLQMPGGGTIEAIRQLQSRERPVHVVVFTGYDDPTDALVSLRAGALAFVVKTSQETLLPVVIRGVMKGERFVDPSLGSRVVDQLLQELDEHPPPPASPLSDREYQVLEMTAAGYNNREIAEQLGVGVKSVDTYRQRLMAKLGLRSRAEMTRYALHMGISAKERLRKKRS